MSADTSFARLAVLTDITPERWRRMLEAPPEVQALEVENLKDQNWTKTTSTVDEVLTLLPVVGEAIGLATGAAGLVTALRAL